MRAVFVPLQRLQQDLERRGRVNTLLVVAIGPARPAAAAPLAALSAAQGARSALEDVGLTLRDARCAAARDRCREPPPACIDRAARRGGRAGGGRRRRRAAQPVLTYLANTIRSGDREVPYSLVTAIDLRSIAPVA